MRTYVRVELFHTYRENKTSVSEEQSKMVSNTEPLAVPVKSRNKGSRGEWLIAGLAIGILSIIGFFMGNFLIVLLSFLFPGLLPYVTFVGIFLVILIIIVSSIGYTYLKKESAFYFMKLFVFSIIVLFSAFALFLIGQSGGVTIMVEKIPLESQINGTIDYLDITEIELNEYPLLRKAIIECRDYNNCTIKPDIEEWGNVSDFLNRKAHESKYLFSINDSRLEEDLDREILPKELRNEFESRGVLLSEKAVIFHPKDIRVWNIIENQEDTYQIWKENEKLNVYNGKWINPYKLKISEKYYNILVRWDE